MAEPTSARLFAPQQNEPDALRPEQQVVTARPILVERPRPATVSSQVRSAGEHAYQTARTAMSTAVARAKRNFRYLAAEKPLQLVLGVAVASLLAGVGLRLWRRHYE
jgi:hypothetical protein